MNTISHRVIGIAALFCTSLAYAQGYPNKPIILSVGFSPGGSADVVARIFAQKMSESLGQQVVIENRQGATGAISAAQVAKAEPDGYRILMQNSGTFTYSVLSKNPPYNVLRDFTPIAYVSVSPLVLIAGPSLPMQNMSELIQLARNKPGEVTFGSEGTGGTSHLAGELFAKMANIKLTHVPFKSAVESSMATASGQINIAFATLTSALPLLRGDRYRALAVGTVRRSTLLPAVPTISESGLKGFDQGAWFGFVGPAGMPKSVVDKLNDAIMKAANQSEVRESLKSKGVEVDIKDQEQFAIFMRDSAAEMLQLAKDVNLKLE